MSPTAANLPGRVGDCAVCPRLCRDVCPVAVHGYRDDFIPSEKMRGVAATLGYAAAEQGDERLLACTDCGACTDYCLLSVPVASWLSDAVKRAGGPSDAYPKAPDPPEIPALSASELEPDAVLLSTCDSDFDGAATRMTAGAPAASEGAAALEHKRANPAALLPGDHGLASAQPALGSTCCGATLRAGVGDDGLRARMARAMVADVRDGAQLVVCEGRCGAWIAAAVGDRLRVVRVKPEGAS